MKRKKCSTLLGRGSIGGMLGGFVYLLTTPDARYLLISGQVYIALAYILPITAVIGAVIGSIIWWLSIKSGRNIRLVMRGVIGFLFLFLVTFFLSLTRSTTDLERFQLAKSKVIYLIVWSMVVGACSGLAIGKQIDEG